MTRRSLKCVSPDGVGWLNESMLSRGHTLERTPLKQTRKYATWRWFLMVGALLVLLQSCGGERKVTAPHTELTAIEGVDAQVRREMSRFDLPGVALFVMRGDEILVNTGYGFQNLETQEPTASKTYFQIGSISKCFTAVAVLKLIEQGKLSLDTPIHELVARTPHHWKKIKIRHLLNHTSGLVEYTTLEDYGDLDFSDPQDTSWQVVFNKIRPLPLYFQPGTRGAYSNTNYHLLAMAVEEVTGKPFNRYLLQFLRSQNIDQVLPMEMAKERVAVGYKQREGIYYPVRPVNPKMVTGDGGLVATAPGLAQWMRALASGQLLSPTMWEAMTEVLEIPSVGTWEYGYGMDLRNLQGEPKLAHTGSMPGYAAAIAYYPRADLTIAVCTNTGDYLYPEQLEINIARELLNLHYPEVHNLPLDDQMINTFTGVFDAGPLWLQVKMEEGKLVALVRDPRVSHAAVYSYSPLMYQGDGRFIGETAPDSLFFRFNPHNQTVAFDVLGIRWLGKRLAVDLP